MSITAERNGSGVSTPTPTSDASSVLDRLRSIGDDARTALIEVEEAREQMAVRHLGEADALREKHRTERQKLTDEAQLLRKVLGTLGTEAPPPARLGPGGRPVQAPKRKVPEQRYKNQKYVTPRVMKSVITALLALTEDGSETTVPQIVRARPEVANDNMSNTYVALEQLRDLELARKGGKTQGKHPADLWGVWDREALIDYMEKLDVAE